MKQNPEKGKAQIEAEEDLAKIPDNALYECLLHYGEHSKYGILLKRIMDLSKLAAIPPRILNYQSPKDPQGLTPLMMVIQRPQIFHNKNLVADLLAAGAGINIKNAGGLNALLFAVSKNNVEAVELLLKHKELDFSIKDKYGRNALMLALSVRDFNRELVLRLMNTSINMEVIDREGNNAFSLFEKNTRTAPHNSLDEKIYEELSKYPLPPPKITLVAQSQVDTKQTKEDMPKSLLYQQPEHKKKEDKAAEQTPPPAAKKEEEDHKKDLDKEESSKKPANPNG